MHVSLAHGPATAGGAQAYAGNVSEGPAQSQNNTFSQSAPPQNNAQRFCPQCGQPITGGAAFCNKCGAKLN